MESVIAEEEAIAPSRLITMLNPLTAEPQKPINETRRFALLVLGCFGSICCSFAYTFDLTAKPMQERYNLTQRDMSTVSTVSMIVLYFALPYAFIYDYLGPMPLCFFAVGTYTIGSLLLIQCYSEGSSITVASICVLCALTNTGSALFNLTSLMTVLGYFPTARGTISALLKSFTGLGAAVLAIIYLAFFSGHPDDFMYLLVSIAMTVGLTSVVFLHLPSYHVTGYERQCILIEEDVEDREALIAQYLRQKVPMGRVIYGFSVVIFLIIFLFIQGVLVVTLKLGSSYQAVFAVIAAVVTLLIFGMILPWERMLIPWRYAKNSATHHQHGNGEEEENSDEVKRAKKGIHHHDEVVIAEEVVGSPSYSSLVLNTPLPITPDRHPSSHHEVHHAAAPTTTTTTRDMEIDYVSPQYQTPFLHNILTIELWTLWWGFFSTGGSALVLVYNSSYIMAALNGSMPDETTRAMLTILTGVGSAVGRLIISGWEGLSLRRRTEDRIPITIVLLLPTTAVIAAIAMLLVLPPKALWAAYLLSGVANGCGAVACALLTRTLYAKDDAKHYCLLLTGFVVAAVALNRFLYGEWIYRTALKQNSAVCYGRECVMMPLIIMLGLCFSCLFSTAFVHWRYRQYCRLVRAEQSRIREPITDES